MNQDTHIILDKELRRDIDAIIQRLRKAERRAMTPLSGDGVDGRNLAPMPEVLAAPMFTHGRKSRERSIVITKLQESVMWLGMDLKTINDESGGAENPYPNSKDPSNTKIDPTADGLKL